jgi:hypothetical protein
MSQVDDLIESRSEYVALAGLTALFRKHQQPRSSHLKTMESRFVPGSNNCKKTAAHASRTGNRECGVGPKNLHQSSESEFFTDD